MVREAGVEPAASRLSIECSNHAELFPDGAPCQIRTGFSGLQVRRIATYAYRACDSGANGANRTLIGCLPCNCSPTELHRLEAEGYSKPRPPRYECGALRASAENRTSFIGLGSDAQPVGHARRNFGADGDNRNLFSGLEAQGTPYIPRPLTYCDADSIVKDRRPLAYGAARLTRCSPVGHTPTASLPTGSKLDRMSQMTV